MTPLAITGLGVVGPLGVGAAAWNAALADPAAAKKRAFGTPTAFDAAKVPGAWAAEAWGFDAKDYLGNKGIRNFDRLTRMMVVAGKHALEDAGLKREGVFAPYPPDRVGICSSTAYGSLDAITELNLVAELEDPRYINPARFPNTVVNAASGYVSIWEDLRGPNVTIVNGNCGSLDTVLSAATHLQHRRADSLLVGGGEVLTDALYLAFRRLGVIAAEGEPHRLVVGEGAAYAVVERAPDAARRGARVLASLAGYGTAFDPPGSDALLVHAAPDAMRRAIVTALADAGVAHRDVDLVLAPDSGFDRYDAAGRAGIEAAVGPKVRTVEPKAFVGESFGAAGAFGIAAALAWMGALPADGSLGTEPPEVVVVTAMGFYGNASAVVLTRS